jgi:hypothetical protein
MAEAVPAGVADPRVARQPNILRFFGFSSGRNGDIMSVTR